VGIHDLVNKHLLSFNIRLLSFIVGYIIDIMHYIKTQLFTQNPQEKNSCGFDIRNQAITVSLLSL